MEIITELEKHEIEKYSRQFILSQVGLKGQIKLRNAKVLAVGVGGLGSPVLMYLVSSGVGTIGIIDHDIVEIHNLQRQVIHKESFLKKSKIESAVDFAKSLNSNVTIVPFNTKLNAENAEKIIKDFDIVLDCSDNVTVRYILNDFSRILAKDFVAASVLRWEGQLFVFSKNGPCYRCMFPEPNQRISSCDEAGVMGPACGIIGSMQALEALKIILEQSESMFIIYNMHKNEYKKFAVCKNTPCQVCITKKHIPLAMQPKSGCKTVPNNIILISWDEFLDKRDKYLLIDVRPKAMYEIAHFKSAINVPVKDVQKYIETNKIEKPIALLCKRGITASTAAECFIANGIDAVVIKGGLQEYKQSHCNDFPLI